MQPSSLVQLTLEKVAPGLLVFAVAGGGRVVAVPHVPPLSTAKAARSGSLRIPTATQLAKLTQLTEFEGVSARDRGRRLPHAVDLADRDRAVGAVGADRHAVSVARAADAVQVDLGIAGWRGRRQSDLACLPGAARLRLEQPLRVARPCP